MSAVRGEYKGSQTISLHKSADGTDAYPFSFGLAKAKLILQHLKQIEQFVEDHEEEARHGIVRGQVISRSNSSLRSTRR